MKRLLLSIGLVGAIFAQNIPSSFDDVGLKSISKEDKEGKVKLLLEVEKPALFVNWLEKRVALGTLTQIAKQEDILEQIKGIKFNAEIDKERFSNLKPDSVLIYPQADEETQKLFQLYLTFDKDNYPIKGRLKEIDEKSQDGSLKSSNINFKCNRDKNVVDCNYQVGQFLISSTQGDMPGEFKINNFNCKITSKDTYNLNQKCILPTLNFYAVDKNSSTTSKANIDNLILFSTMNLKKSKLLDSNNYLKIGRAYLFSDEGNRVDLNISDININWSVSNIDKKSIELSNRALERDFEDKEGISLLKDLILTLTRGGAEYKFDYSIGEAKVTTADENLTINLLLSKLASKYQLYFDDTIEYSEHTELNSLEFEEKKSKSKALIKNFEYGLSLENLKNFIPELMPTVEEIAIYEIEHNKSEPTKEQMEKLTKLANSVIQNGFTFKVSPLSIEKFSRKSENLNEEYGPDSINIEATLDKNSADISSQLGLMLLLGYIKADAKIILTKSDYDTLIKGVPAQFAGIISLIAKEKDGKVVFDIKSKDGKLIVNGQKIM